MSVYCYVIRIRNILPRQPSILVYIILHIICDRSKDLNTLSNTDSSLEQCATTTILIVMARNSLVPVKDQQTALTEERAWILIGQ